MHECLFYKDTKRSIAQKGMAMFPKCKTTNSRQACLNLIKEIATLNASSLRLFTDYMRDTIYGTKVSASWRTP
jgi:hypothetical protein